MPRRPRIVLPNVPLHIIQRGNNRQACFYARQDYHVYLEWLGKYAVETGCTVHAYVLMTNHVHLLLTPENSESVGHMMKKLGQRYVQYVNRTYRRSGTLWEGRYRSCLIQSEIYLYTCHRYIELNPVRAKLVDHPADYPWSSYQANGHGVSNGILKPHPLYEALGRDMAERQIAYRELYRHELGPDVIDEIRKSTNGNFVLGDRRFAEQIEAKLGRRATPGRSGRPKRD
ncbi:MAG: transposase [gamma proteobacterium symbiont of Ctena orbiculata]|nr:MAG: transposase [gamma proteobacterium symbiont of Ctena orbiculata]PVV18125.1 MAG: transposase [gamma proteobacterium symbiont of Ctena orbiculata]